jgi:hypothetical protein
LSLRGGCDILRGRVEFTARLLGNRMNDENLPAEQPPEGQFLLYQTEDGHTRIECRFAGESIWLTQALTPVDQLRPRNPLFCRVDAAIFPLHLGFNS